MLHAIVMAGGSGTRFWPASRAALPKQLLPLAGEKTLLEDTVERLAGLVPPERMMVVTSQRLLPAVHAQLPGGLAFGHGVILDAILGHQARRLYRDGASRIVAAPLSRHTVLLAASLRGRQDPPHTEIDDGESFSKSVAIVKPPD